MKVQALCVRVLLPDRHEMVFYTLWPGEKVPGPAELTEEMTRSETGLVTVESTSWNPYGWAVWDDSLAIAIEVLRAASLDIDQWEGLARDRPGQEEPEEEHAGRTPRNVTTGDDLREAAPIPVKCPGCGSNAWAMMGEAECPSCGRSWSTSTDGIR